MSKLNLMTPLTFEPIFMERIWGGRRLEAHDKLSLQVHPPEKIADRLGGESKTEFWYIAGADPGAELYLGFRESITLDQFEKALRDGTAADYIHKIQVKTGDAVFLPSGRLHALGAGNLLIEVQQNSDTTYRVFDWNRVDDKGKQRQLHIDQALQCIDFDDVRPRLLHPDGDRKSTRLNSSHITISYAVFCLKKKK